MEFPNFSIILETENLATAHLNKLAQAIATLAKQELPPTAAQEVLLIETGDVPADLLESLRHTYPWLTVHRAPADLGYYAAKMLGAKLATGEIVVYCDSDCVYEPQWLGNLLAPFRDRPEVQVVAGETITRGVGPYATAMALTYLFPQYSHHQTLTPTPNYYLNNVAFRREFLLQHPMPTDLPLYRGNCVVHAQQLRQQGYTIWQQPTARATHPAPDKFLFFLWRFVLIGHDLYWQQRLMEPSLSTPNQGDRYQYFGVANQLQALGDRFTKMIVYDSRHLCFLPLALPIVCLSLLLIGIGYGLTVLFPQALLQRDPPHPTASESHQP